MIKGAKVRLFYAAIAFILFLFACLQAYRGVIEFNIVVLSPLLIAIVLVISYFVVKNKK